MFRKAADFGAFERVMVEAHQREAIRILAYCILSNHWHFVVWVPGTPYIIHDGSSVWCPRNPCLHVVSRRFPTLDVATALAGGLEARLGPSTESLNPVPSDRRGTG